MPDVYIKKEDAVQAILSVPKGNWSNARYKEAVEEVPFADVEEKRYGQWVKARDRGVVSYSELYAECSVCHGAPVFAGRLYGRCPHCGAYLSVEGKNG